MKQRRRKPARTPKELNLWIARLYGDRELLRMGHQQSKADLNLGLGWLYYALARILRPDRVVVIGSWRGFVPMVFARALADNGDGGEVLFIDPSLADGFWKDARAVARHFRSYGLANIRHVLLTTQDFVRTREYRGLRDLKIVFIDGYHTHEQAKFDYEAFADRLAPDGIALFHDTLEYDRSRRNRRVSRRFRGRSHRYRRSYVRTVRKYMHELIATPGLQVYDLPFGGGVTLVRRVPAGRVGKASTGRGRRSKLARKTL